MLTARLLLLACALVWCGTLQAQELDPSIYDQAWRVTRDSFYERSFNGLDWEALGDKHRPRAEQARTQAEVHEAIIDLLAELKTSHAAIIEPDVYLKHYDSEAKSLLAPQFGLKLTRLEDGFFISEILAGSPAAAAGLLRGDRVLGVDGQAPDPAILRPVPYDAGLGGPRSYRLVSKRAGVEVNLDLERFERPKGLFSVQLRAAPWNEVEASRASRRIIEKHGLKLGYMRLYHVLSEDIVDMLEEQLGQLDDADGMLLDVRGRGGLPVCIKRILEYFDPNTPGGPLWGRPVVCLIDGGTRSAKEVLAYTWRQRGIGPLVGRTTRGAVLGARFAPLRDGAYLILPMMDMRTLSKGVILEGVGVAPDVEVAVDLPWCQGRDAIFDKGLEVLIDEVWARRRRGKAHGWH